MPDFSGARRGVWLDKGPATVRQGALAGDGRRAMTSPPPPISCSIHNREGE